MCFGKVYDKELKQMTQIELEDLIQSDFWFDGETDMWTVVHDITHNQKRFILYKSSQIKDCNGKEIFSGDFIKVPIYFININTPFLGEPDFDGNYIGKCIYGEEHNVNSIFGFGIYLYNTYTKRYDILVESDEWDEFEIWKK